MAREEPEAPQKQLTPALAACPVLPRCPPHPCSWGHQWPRDNFPGPGRRQRNLHLYLHFLIAPAGFLGQRLALVSMAGFVWTPRTEGGTKGPQWTCHSLASKAAGGAGWDGGTTAGGTAAWPPPSAANTGADAGTPPGRGRGRPAADTRGTLVVLAQSSGGDTTPAGLLRGARTRPSCPPLFSFPVIFRRLFIHLGWVSFLLPYSI